MKNKLRHVAVNFPSLISLCSFQCRSKKLIRSAAIEPVLCWSADGSHSAPRWSLSACTACIICYHKT